MFRWYWKVVVWAVVVFTCSVIPGNEVGRFHLFNIPDLDKIIHFTLYLILGLLSIQAFKIQDHSNTLRRYPALFSFAFAMIYGGGLELLQEFAIVARSAQFSDMIANAFGLLTASFIIKLWFFHRVKLCNASWT